MNDAPLQPIIAWDHRTSDACLFNDIAARILPLLETRVLPVAKPGERVVLTHGMPIPPELRLLNHLGFGCEEADLLFIDSSIRSKPPLRAGTVIHPFTSASALSQDLYRHAESASFRGCERDMAIHVNRKATLQRWASSEIRVPEGHYVESLAEIRDAALALLASHRSVVYKPDFSASGIGQVRFTQESNFSDEALGELMLPGVVQQYVNKTCDVSLQFEISVNWGAAIGNGPSVQPHLRELTGQFVSAEGDYLGGYYPTRLSALCEANIRRMGSSIVACLLKMGYRGVGSIDFLVNESTGEIWANDVNARVVAPWYPLEMIRRRHPSHRPLPFIMRSFKIPIGMSIASLEELFHGHFFSRESCEGFVPFAFLPQVGFCYGAVFAQKFARCVSLDQAIKEAKEPLCLYE